MNQKNECNSLRPRRRSFSFSLGFLSMLVCLGTQFALASPELNVENLKFTNSLQATITGTVVDANGAPLPGANVLVKGTTNGTQTDFDGNYSIEADANATLVFSYIGFSSQEVAVNGQSSINITLIEDASQLDEVVITGYSAQNTRDITGSVTTVKSEALAATAPLNFEEALQGQSSGVIVGNQGGPGSGAIVRIRGYGTINGNDPLYIIDGTPTDAGLTEINPNDIESVQILKDASSAAIYGNRAANGVIIVTTKSGKRNSKVNFSADAYVGVDFIPSSVYPDLATPQQLADAVWEANANDGTVASNPQYGSGPTPVLPVYLFPQGAQTADESSYSFPDNRITRANPQGTDWFDEYFDNAITRNFNVSASGGSEDSNFFMSLGALDQEGVALGTNFTRYNLRTNSSFDITDKFRVGENVSITYSEQVVPPGADVNNGAIASLFRINPLIPVRDVGGNFAGSGVGGLGNGRNPIGVAERESGNDILSFRALGNFYAEYDIIENLTFKTNLGFDLWSVNTSSFDPASFENEAPTNNLLTEYSSLRRTYTWFNTLTYNKSFGEHDFDVLLGTEYNRDLFRQTQSSIGGFLFDDVENIRFLQFGTGAQNAVGNGFITSYFSGFGKVDYKYKDTYLLSGTLRYDSSSLFNEDQRDGFFPSVSAGWRISNEAFMTDSNVFTDLMLKVGYGVVANDGNIAANATSDTFSPNADFFSYPNSNTGSATGYGLNNRGNPDLEWETTTTLNIGISSRLFDMLTFDFEYYDAKTEDMLLAVGGDPTVLGSVNTIVSNLGEMTNKGFDAALGYGNNNPDGFNYNIGLNISGYTNEVTVLDPDNADFFILGQRLRDQNPTRTQAGQPLSSFYGKVFTGIGADGRMQFANGGEQEYIGNPHPDFTYGVSFSGNYRNLDFSLLIQGSQGNDLYNFLKFFTDFNTFPGAKSVNYVNSNGLPALTNDAGIISEESAQSSYYVEDGSYARLKNIVIGYTLPEAITEKLGVSKIRWYLQGKNLLTLTDYTGLDPEVNLRNTGLSDGNSISLVPTVNTNLTIGVDSGVFPITRSLILGLNVSF
ncbi:SusC/RagA family TonB-linked outer membrane protein [Spongiimicrobium sp. 3-5]|uniref:SusC/RagA family TonB-linked outer membrane protein n=1 Tax=Spongiimicrobium sp. 3-5 TaxID=3332596 RepID=UPI003980CD9C